MLTLLISTSFFQWKKKQQRKVYRLIDNQGQKVSTVWSQGGLTAKSINSSSPLSY